MSDVARTVLDAIKARDGLKLPAEESERLVGLYAEMQPELAEMHSAEYRYAEPDCTSPP